MALGNRLVVHFTLGEELPLGIQQPQKVAIAVDGRNLGEHRVIANVVEGLDFRVPLHVRLSGEDEDLQRLCRIGGVQREQRRKQQRAADRGMSCFIILFLT
jgi:hypothetical protein